MIEFAKAFPAALYSGILGALIAMISVYLTNKSNIHILKLQLELERKTKEAEFMRDKLEELYLLHEAWMNALSTSYLPFLSVMKGEITYDQALDLFIENNKTPQANFKRLQMLVDLYFPEIKPAFTQLSAARVGANKIKAEHKREYKRGNIDGFAYVAPFIEAQKKLASESLTMKEQIILRSSRHHTFAAPPSR